MGKSSSKEPTQLAPPPDPEKKNGEQSTASLKQQEPRKNLPMEQQRRKERTSEPSMSPHFRPKCNGRRYHVESNDRSREAKASTRRTMLRMFTTRTYCSQLSSKETMTKGQQSIQYRCRRQIYHRDRR